MSDGINPWFNLEFICLLSILRAIALVDLAVLADDSTDSVPEVLSCHDVIDLLLV